ncbi:MAG: hypothetical protein LH606_08375 [Cytophagaceae bacterium]|nr:hypothetical protein [Cytophagaceae bacterium]
MGNFGSVIHRQKYDLLILNQYEFYFCDYGQSENTEANAFKHAYWSALNTQTWGSSIALEIGQNHEQNTDTHNQHAMDLHNDDVGINIGEALPDASFENLAREVLEHLASGAGRKLSNPSDRNSSIIDTNGAMLCRSRLE